MSSSAYTESSGQTDSSEEEESESEKKEPPSQPVNFEEANNDLQGAKEWESSCKNVEIYSS